MTSPLAQGIATSIFAITTYKAGKTIEQTCQDLGLTNPIKLSSNENPLGTGKQALAVLSDVKNFSPHRYPDSTAVRLRKAIANDLKISCELIICGNGSNEILELAATLTLRPGRKAVFSEHAFIVYKLVTMSRGANPIIVPAAQLGHDLIAMAAACQDENVGIVFVANPNNPTGTWHDPNAIVSFLRKVPPGVLVVLDEAYIQYAEDGRGSSLELLAKFPNLLITRTFSKIHGLAGLRIGYGISGPELIKLCNTIRQPFNANAVAQVAAVAALSDAKFIQQSRATNATGMLQLQQGFANLGYPTIPSRGNFLAFSAHDAKQTFHTLLKAGIVIREIEEYGLPGWLRTTIGTCEHNERLLQALPHNNPN